MKHLINFIKIILIFTFFCFLIPFLYHQKTVSPIKKVDVETLNDAVVSELYIYGKFLNIKGSLEVNNTKEVYLSFIDELGSKIDYKTNFYIDENRIMFSLGDRINSGFNLEKLSFVNKYKMYLKVIYLDDTSTYHKLNNQSGYNTTEYYTIYKDNENKKITIGTTDTLEYEITSNEQPVYDIILDAGHGGNDPGACYKNKKPCERDYTKNIVKAIKSNLEKKGFKVAFTWDIDKIKIDNYIPFYGEGSRVESTYKSYAKYSISIHLNSSSTTKLSGFEIYTPYNINYTFAKSMRDNIKNYTNAPYSNNKFNRKESGIYTRTFSNQEVKTTNKERIDNNLALYDINTKTNYYYMIRETGGYMTGAFVNSPSTDNREINNYHNSNRGLESYIVELAYINNLNDLRYFEKNIDKYVNAISDSIIAELN